MWKIVWGSVLYSVLVGWMSPVTNHVNLMITLPVLSKLLTDGALMAGGKLSLEELNDPLWHQQSCKAAASPSGRWRVCDGIWFSASTLSYLQIWQHTLLAEMSHSQGMTLGYRGFYIVPRRNCCFNLNVLAACQMTRNEVRAAGWVVSWFCNESQLTDKEPWKQPDLFHLLWGMIPLCTSVWAQWPVSSCWRCLHWQQEKRNLKAEAQILTSAVLLDFMEYLGYAKDAHNDNTKWLLNYTWTWKKQGIFHFSLFA